MATVGQQLTSPEAGFQRIQQNDSHITYGGTGWVTSSNGTSYDGGSEVYTGTLGDYAAFNIVGNAVTLLAYVDYLSAGKATMAQVIVDGVLHSTVSMINPQGTNWSTGKDRVIAVVSGLSDGEHSVKLLNVENNAALGLDCIDIPSTATLKAYCEVYPASNLMAAIGAGNVTLSWTKGALATSYNVKRASTQGGPYTVIATEVTTNSYSDNSVVDGSHYYYVVTSVKGSAESVASNEVSVILALPAPTNLVATVADNQVNLGWDAVNNANGYNVKRSTIPGGPYTVVGTNVSGTTFSDKTVTNGIPYHYVVTTICGVTESLNSNEVSATPEGTRLLKIVMSSGSTYQYKLLTSQLNGFITWITNKTNAGSSYAFINPFDGSIDNLEFNAVSEYNIRSI